MQPDANLPLKCLHDPDVVVALLVSFCHSKQTLQFLLRLWPPQFLSYAETSAALANVGLQEMLPEGVARGKPTKAGASGVASSLKRNPCAATNPWTDGPGDFSARRVKPTFSAGHMLPGADCADWAACGLSADSVPCDDEPGPALLQASQLDLDSGMA